MTNYFSPTLARDKHDTKNAEALMAAGWEKILPAVPHSSELATALQNEIQRMADNPTAAERLEGIKEAAREIVEKPDLLVR